MFAIAMILLTVGAVLGGVVLAVALAFLLMPKLRTCAWVVLSCGVLGALAALGFFAVFVIVVEHGREPVFSSFTAVLVANGFGSGGLLGAVAYSIRLVFKSPNRWVDRQRLPRAH